MFEEKLQEAFKEYGLMCSKDTALKFNAYYKMVIERNKQMNLTAITDEDGFIRKHILDSLSFVKYAEKSNLNFEGKSVLDLGAGAGFPGIPLKIYLENLNLTLMDALQKRVNFLNEVIDELNLNGISAFHGRAEEIARNDLRESFDMAVSRAVAVLPVLLEYVLPFVKVGGFFIAWKGGKAKEEVKLSENALKILGGKIIEINKVEIPKLDEERALIIIKKERRTPSKYPRQSGAPKKKSL